MVVVRDLANALRDVGFVTLTNTGVSSDTVDIFARAKEFFALPPHALARMLRKQDCQEESCAENTNTYSGYFPPTLNGKHGLDIGPHGPDLDAFFDETRNRRLPLEEVQLWPLEQAVGATKKTDEVPAGWKEEVQDYYKTMQNLGNHIMRAIAIAWNLPPESLIREVHPFIYACTAPLTHTTSKFTCADANRNPPRQLAAAVDPPFQLLPRHDHAVRRRA